MFIVSFIVVTVKARLIGFDRHLEEAAMDLGANELTTFRKVTLPLLAPAIVAAALLGFALSIDDFVVTFFNSGSQTQTFPMYVWTTAQRALPSQINVVASAIFIVAMTIALGNVVWQYRSAKRAREPRDRDRVHRPAARRQGAPLDAFHPHGRVRCGGRADHRPR